MFLSEYYIILQNKLKKYFNASFNSFKFILLIWIKSPYKCILYDKQACKYHNYAASKINFKNT